MKEFFKLCVITVAGMTAIASILHLAVALGQNESPWNALIYLGISSGALGLMGLLDTAQRLEQQMSNAPEAST